MMMGALAAGGLDAAYDPAWDDVAKTRGIPDQNPAGFFELSIEMQSDPSFPTALQGRTFKVQHTQLPGLAPGNYRVIAMLRDPSEIRASYRKMGPASEAAFIHWNTDADYFRLMARFYGAARQRLDMEVIDVNYADVLASPDRTFSYLRDAGVPIDVVRAAATIRDDLYRNRAKTGAAS